jgi:hypothetical protein
MHRIAYGFNTSDEISLLGLLRTFESISSFGELCKSIENQAGNARKVFKTGIVPKDMSIEFLPTQKEFIEMRNKDPLQEIKDNKEAEEKYINNKINDLKGMLFEYAAQQILRVKRDYPSLSGTVTQNFKPEYLEGVSPAEDKYQRGWDFKALYNENSEQILTYIQVKYRANWIESLSYDDINTLLSEMGASLNRFKDDLIEAQRIGKTNPVKAVDIIDRAAQYGAKTKWILITNCQGIDNTDDNFRNPDIIKGLVIINRGELDRLVSTMPSGADPGNEVNVLFWDKVRENVKKDLKEIAEISLSPKTLKPFQEEVVKTVMNDNNKTINLPSGTGKTLLIAETMIRTNKEVS